LYHLLNIVKNKINNTLSSEIEKIKGELSEYGGFIEDVSDYEADLEGRLRDILNGNGSDVSTPESIGNGSGNGKATKNFLKNITKDASIQRIFHLILKNFAEQIVRTFHNSLFTSIIFTDLTF